MSIYFYLFSLCLLSFLSFLFGMFKYKGMINPLSIHVILVVGIFTILSSLNVLLIDPNELSYNLEYISKTYYVSFINLFGILIPYFFKSDLALFIYKKLLKLFRIQKTYIINFNYRTVIFISFIFVFSYCGLMIQGGGNLIWLYAPREGYMWFRSGAGHFYILCHWFLTLLFLYFIWTTRPNKYRLFYLSLIFLSISYFLGKKAMMVHYFIISIIYYHFYIKKINSSKLIFITLILLFFVYLLILITGGGNLLEGLTYFEYFNVTTLFLSRFDEFGFYYGRVLITSLWGLVPRSIFSDKPYEYGPSLVHQVLFPGTTEVGITAGYIGWTPTYLDFGTIGVFITGILTGLFQKVSYEYYLINRSNFIAFVLMIQFSIFEIWVFSQYTIIVLIWCYFIIFILKRFNSIPKAANLSTKCNFD
jgi:oligosaccharide repeat unit polymerase